MKTSLFLLSSLATTVALAFPVVDGVTLVQETSNAVRIDYRLSEAPAIVTLDIQTNVTGGAWESIGGGAVVA